MYIKEIKLQNFRNYREEKVSFNKNVNLFLGENAQGKTNLLEGIYLNVLGKSFKNVRDKDLIMFGKDFCRITTTHVSAGEDHTTEIVISRDGKKGIKADGVKLTRTSELLDRLFMIVFSPEDLKIVKEDPEKRRRFIDRELCQIKSGYLSDLNDYRHILKQRNAYLKGDRIDMDMLSIWDSQMDEYGNRIIEKRKSFIKKIDKISCEIHNKITGGKEVLELKYEPNEFNPALVSEDLRNRNTGHGPHRDDFRISANGVDLRKYGSQGQQRTAALSLKLSEKKIIEEEKGEKAILLLDDVLSELDNERQVYLMNSLGENQMFITTTDIVGKVARNLPEGKVIKIRGGEVTVEI
ncbi:MAG: DNA replication/repair protein RecF [Eubacteriales bacterium]|nr:DNA replication/repair protein RecF [Eubacteriales bacterium]